MRRRNVVFKTVGVLIVGLIAVSFWLGHSSRELTMTIMDIGQGDSILIRTPGGNDILVDGGPDGSVIDALSRNLPAADRIIELVVLTHPDLDHVGGLPEVAGRYHIDRVLETSVRSSSSADKRWEQSITEQGSQRTKAEAGEVFHIDDVTLTVLWPTSGEDLEKLDRNDTSVTILMTYGSSSFLLTGDAGAYVEERLLQQGVLHDIDVLKVGHHGSITSSSEPFLDIIKPEVAAISVGQYNTFGHPHPVVLRRLEKRGIKIFRTDQHGDIVIKSNGQGVRVTP